MECGRPRVRRDRVAGLAESGKARLQLADLESLSDPAAGHDFVDRIQLRGADVGPRDGHSPAQRLVLEDLGERLGHALDVFRFERDSGRQIQPKRCELLGDRKPHVRPVRGQRVDGVEERSRVDVTLGQPRLTASTVTRVSVSRTEYIQNALFAHDASGWSVILPACASGARHFSYQLAISRFLATKPGSRFIWAKPTAAWRLVIR